MKTIAISLNTTWNIYNFRLGLIKALQKEGYKVVAIAPKDEYVKKLEDEGVECFDIKMNNKGTNPIEDLKLISDYIKVYKKAKPDIILSYTIKPNIYGSIAAGILKIPVISNISGLGTVFLNDSISSKIARNLYKLGLKFPKKVFFQNSDDRKLFIKNKLVDAKKTDLLPGSGIDTNKFAPIAIQRDDKKIKFLMIARLVGDKGLYEYLQVAEMIKKKYKNVEFLLLGAFYPGNPTAITQEELESWVSKGVINYLGVSDNVKEEIAKVDCIVLPSYREGLSRVLLEAGSMAKPIVTTDTAGCRDVVEDSLNGYLCKVKDEQSLAMAMEKIVNLNFQDRIKMGQLGREKVIKEFDENIVIKKYIDTINNILGENYDKQINI